MKCKIVIGFVVAVAGAYGVIHPALHLTGGQDAVDQARWYAGRKVFE